MESGWSGSERRCWCPALPPQLKSMRRACPHDAPLMLYEFFPPVDVLSQVESYRFIHIQYSRTGSSLAVLGSCNEGQVVIVHSRRGKIKGCQWPSSSRAWGLAEQRQTCYCGKLSSSKGQAGSSHPPHLGRTFFPFVIFPSHFSDWTRYLWTVIYSISQLILCSAILKDFCGPVPQGDIYFFSLLMF